jgi:gliding motility-associated-like protein
MASHIVGGELVYDYLGNNKYKITLKIYRDCNSSNNGPFDGNGGNSLPAYITVYSENNTLEGVFDIGSPTISPVPPAFTNPCIKTPGFCVEEGIYVDTLTLPPKTGGYLIVYQRCCRNANVVNLVNSGLEGSSYFTKIPGPEDAPINNSPRFTKLPPLFICNNVNFKFDHSVTDPDGDQLLYSLSSPFTGLDGCCPSLGISTSPSSSSFCPSPPASCPQEATPPPYLPVLFSSPYSGTYPIPSNPAFSINPVSGQLSGTPNLIGQYVVGIRVDEYRNNALINTHFRDFQFTVLGCTVSVISAIAEQKQQCQGLNITFTNQSTNNSTSPVYQWDFGVTNLSNDTSNLFSPSYLYPDTGIYTLSLIVNPGKPCTDTLKKPIYVYPPLKINYPRPNKQCFKNNSFNFTAGGVYLPLTTYSWDFTTFGVPSTSTLKNPVGISFTEGGLFLVKLKAKQFACRDSFTDSVRVIPRPKARINNLQNGLCDPATIGFSNGSSSELSLTYFWEFSTGKTSKEFEPTQLFSPAGTYGATLTVETSGLCKDTAKFSITNILVNPKPISSFTITPKETSIFEPDVTVKSYAGDGVLSSFFTFGDGGSSSLLSVMHTYSDFGNYKITQTVVNGFGCVDSSSDIVRVLPEFRFWIPNAFSPDDNLKNDVFMPKTIGIRNYEFEIFNRWGQRIFVTINPEEGWTGFYKGLECPQGIYVWKIKFKNLASEETELRMGHVTLLRTP